MKWMQTWAKSSSSLLLAKGLEESFLKNIKTLNAHCFRFFVICNMWIYICAYVYHIASLVAQMVKNLPVVQKMQIRSLGQEDSLEEEMATYSSILAWRIPWIEEPGGL